MAYVVLISTDDSAAAARWLSWLRAEPQFQTRLPCDSPLPEVVIDVVLTDRPTLDPQTGSSDAIVIGVGSSNGEVSLPADCLPRELVLACRLSAELVQARRKILPPETRGHDDLSMIDALTGLPNRRAWQQELATRLAATVQQGDSLCLAIVDLDHFKQLNAGWGHSAGDRLLVASAHALRARLRPDDYVARLGGDEFGLLFSGLNRENAQAVVERVRTGVPMLAAREAPHVVGCSAGFACSSDSRPLTAAALFDAADGALAVAKKQGRDVTVGDGSQ